MRISVLRCALPLPVVSATWLEPSGSCSTGPASTGSTPSASGVRASVTAPAEVAARIDSS
ncbi:hypothetical protein WY02_11770 [Pseudonocardia sp. AL041005-10]|nr:hypothetical protein WY02_11770 [Pseudonocardia sp. AL041005-10]